MRQLRAFLVFFFTLSEVRWWMWRARTQLLDEEVEKYHLRALFLQLGQLVGMSAGLTLLLFNLALRSPADNVYGVELLLPDTTTEIIVPNSPGNTTALVVCKDGIVSKGAGMVHIEGAGAMQDGYSAVLGPERMTYTDYPKGGKNLVVILNGQPQTVQEEVVKCLLSRGR